MRKALSIGIVLSVIAWLVLSYLPGARATLSGLLPADLLPRPLLTGLAVAALWIFVAIQLYLVGAAVRITRLSQTGEPAAQPAGLQLSLRRELFWTALPLLMTIAVALASYRLWLNLAPP